MDNFTGCAQECAEVSWAHIGMQMGIAGVAWLSFTVVGLIITLALPRWVADNRFRVSHWEDGLASVSVAKAAGVFAVHIVQVVGFVTRASSGQVEPILYGVELITMLYGLMDVLAGWVFLIAGGRQSVLASAFLGRVAVDCLVGTAAIAVLIPGFDGTLTWFSFDFLASIRMMRICRKVQRVVAAESANGWAFNGVVDILCLSLFVYAASAGILVLERLGDPEILQGYLGGEGITWDMPMSIAFACSTFLTLGGREPVPNTIFGRFSTIWLIVWSLAYAAFYVLPIMRDSLFGRNLGNGIYTPRCQKIGGHLVVMGTPTTQMLWDFITEVYHPNHFESGSDFDYEATDVVIMLPCRQTLQMVASFLSHRRSLRFRPRVFLLRGDPFNHADRARVALTHARQAVILPDLNTADVTTDDAANIMRMYSLCGTAPHVRKVCLLHRAEHKPSTLSAGMRNCEFVSIDAFKLSLLSKACLSRGALALIANLCKTVGDDTEERSSQWLVEYQRSLGIELYEVDFCDAYMGSTFGEVWQDMLARSPDADVYLIGYVEESHNPMDPLEPPSRKVRLHPGPDAVINRQVVSGVFLAPDVSSIIQMSDTEQNLGHNRSLFTSQTTFSTSLSGSLSPSSRPGSPMSKSGSARLTYRRRALNEDPVAPDDEPPKSAEVRSAIVRKEPHDRLLLREAASEDMTLAAPAEDSFRPQRSRSRSRPQRLTIQPEEEDSEEDLPARKYDEVMMDIRRTLMATGLGPITVNEVAQREDTPDIPSPQARARQARQQEARARSKAEAEVKAMFAPIPVDPRKRPPAMMTKQERDMENLRQQYEMQDKAANPQPPPAAVLAVGGHFVLCVVSDTACSGAPSSGGLGPRLGLEYFMRPLRETGEEASQPIVVVLAEALPRDWNSIAADRKIFFVRGSPLNPAVLEKTGFAQARAIAIVRGHELGDLNTTARVSDARVLLVASMIDSRMPHTSQTTVITDLSFAGSLPFLPVSIQKVDAPVSLQEKHPAAPSVDLQQIVSDSNASVMNASTMAQLQESDFADKSVPEEDYSELEAADPAFHHRFMEGNVFLASAMTGMVANTFYNPSLMLLVDSLARSPMLLLPLPAAWERKTYAKFANWLLAKKNLLALGIYRNDKAANAGLLGQIDDGAMPSHHFVYTAPPAFATSLLKGDRIIALAPPTDEG